MAFFTSRSASRLSKSIGLVTATGVVAYTYFQLSGNRIALDAKATKVPSSDMATTFSFPKTMMSSRVLTVTDVQEINHDTKRISFSLPHGASESSGVPASSAILTQHWPKGGWFPCFRPYTPVHDRNTPGVLQLVVKRYENGVASNYIHSLRPGDKLTARGPLPGYRWQPAKTPRDAIFIAGGAGITPIYSLASHVLANPDDMTRIQLLWGVNGTRDIVFRDELERLQRQYPERLRVTYAVSGPESAADSPMLGGPGDSARYVKGHVRKELIDEVLKSTDAKTFGDHKGTKVWLCGPPAMEDAVAGKQGALGQLGITKKMIHRF